ncbi:MAG: DUF3078 domain-containing protein [Bacteroidetes bacterium]|nr:DUF3078 domain-containing protein [Bacteroidota bacterium]
MKKVFIIIFLFSGLISMAQTADTIKNWKIENKVSLNFTQSYFSNWSAGGENTLATTGKYSILANYTKEKHKWDNWLDLGLGYSLIGDNDPMKTDDKIELISSYGYKFHPKLYATILLTFKSQFAKGYDYKVDSTNFISKFMAPGTIDIGPGIEWKPNDFFSLNFSPATAKWLIVNDQVLADLGSFGLDPATFDSATGTLTHAKKIKTMFGAKALVLFTYEIFENVNFNTKLELFSDYLKNPQNIDINWQVALTLKVNSWLNVNINTELIYDDNTIFHDIKGAPIGPRTQFNENMQLGLVATF